MAVFRIERTRDYTVMSNHHLRNANLSLKAKGLLSMMLSLPEDWNYTTRGLAKICKEGVDAIGAALRELEAAGYIVRHKLRDSQGRISDTEYVIYEQPQLRKPDTDSPDTENPYMDKPDTEKPAGLNIEKSNTQKQNIYGSSTDSIPFRDCAAAGRTIFQTMSIFLGVLAFKIHRQPQTNTAAQPYQQVQWMQAWPETLQRPRQNRNQRKKLF